MPCITNISTPRNAEFSEMQGPVMQSYLNTESDRLAQEASKQAMESARKGESLEEIAKHYGATVKTAAPLAYDGAARYRFGRSSGGRFQGELWETSSDR